MALVSFGPRLTQAVLEVAGGVIRFPALGDSLKVGVAAPRRVENASAEAVAAVVPEKKFLSQQCHFITLP